MIKGIKVFTLSFFYIGVFVFIATVLSLAIRWEQMDAINRIAHIIVIGLTLHQFEEYRWPSGFAYGYNVIGNSLKPDRYPLNQLSAYCTNVIALIIAISFLFFGMSPVVAAIYGFFCLAEFIVHTVYGVSMLKRYRSKGKETIYFPGSATCWFILIPAGFAMIYELCLNNLLSPLGWGLGVAGIIMFAILVIIVPGKIFENIDSPYNYEQRHYEGYFKKFSDVEATTTKPSK